VWPRKHQKSADFRSAATIISQEEKLLLLFARCWPICWPEEPEEPIRSQITTGCRFNEIINYRHRTAMSTIAEHDVMPGACRVSTSPGDNSILLDTWILGYLDTWILGYPMPRQANFDPAALWRVAAIKSQSFCCFFLLPQAGAEVAICGQLAALPL